MTEGLPTFPLGPFCFRVDVEVVVDPEADAAMMTVAGADLRGGWVVPVDAPGGTIATLTFSPAGLLVGVELLRATQQLDVPHD